MRRSISLLVLFVGLLMPGEKMFLYADGSEEYLEMALFGEGLVSVASKTQISVDQAPSTVYAFSGEQLQKEGYYNLQDFLASMPGVQTSASRKGHSVAWFRGVQSRYNDKVLLLIDGVPVRENFYGSFSIDDVYSMNMIEKIEIVMGPGSVLYGTNAFGGVISITTKKAKNDLSLRYGTYNTKEVSTNLSYKKVSVYGSCFKSSDSFTPEYGRDGKARRLDQEDTKEAYYAGGKLDLLDNLTFNINTAEFEYPQLYSKYERTGIENIHPLMASLHFFCGSVETLKFEATAYCAQYDYYEKETKYSKRGDLIPLSVNYEYKDTRYGGADMFFTKEIGRQSLVFGASCTFDKAQDVHAETLDIETGEIEEKEIMEDEEATYNNYAVYLQDIIRMYESLYLTLGLRHDVIDDFDNDTNYRVGLVYHPDTFFMKALYGTAFRTPSYREYKNMNDGLMAHDPELEAEHLETYEVSFGNVWDTNKKLMLTCFYNIYKDFINDVTDESVDDEVYHNYSKMEMMGCELSGDIRLGEKFGMTPAITFTDSENKDTSAEVQGLAPWTAYIRFSCNPVTALNTSLVVHYVSERDVSDQYQIDSDTLDKDLKDSYTLLDANITYTFNENLNIQVIGRNIADKEYYIPSIGPDSDYDYEMPGSSFYFVTHVKW